jgi:hypothetical protein
MHQVWKHPPTEKKMAPMRIVMRRPYLSASVAASRDVTKGVSTPFPSGLSPLATTRPVRLTECPDLEHGDHAACQYRQGG